MPPAATTPEPDYYTTAEDEVDFWSKFRQSAVSRSNDTALPDGFPNSLASPLVWDGADMARREDEWVLLLDGSETESIAQGLEHFRGRYLKTVGFLALHAAYFETVRSSDPPDGHHTRHISPTVSFAGETRRHFSRMLQRPRLLRSEGTRSRALLGRG